MTDKRIVLVTGASRGIGEAAARALARSGSHVVALARSKQALETLDDAIQAEGGSATLIPMDLKDGEAVDKLGEALLARFGRLDGLLANAGVLGTIGTLQTVSPRSFEDTIAVNLTANWRLIRALDPALRQSPAPRAVFVSSGIVDHPRAFWGPYQASKAGLEALIYGWADETEKSSMRVNLFNPGPTRTDMRANAMPGEDPMTLPTPDEVAELLVPMLSADETRHGVRVNYR